MGNYTIGDKVPDITLVDQDGKGANLTNYVGQFLVVFFYPKDETAICTQEVCSFNEALYDFNELNVKVFGISSDSVESHKKFHEKHQLKYSLLSDEDSTLRKMMGATFLFELISNRTTFIIDKEGRIAARYDAFLESKGHVKWAKEKLKDLEYRSN